MHEGHRQRILERLSTGAAGLQDHELLEILLFNALPRKNTNPIAHDLLRAFGSLAGVLHAEVEQLKAVKGVGDEVARYLRCTGLIFDRVARAKRQLPSAYSLDAFIDYLSDYFADAEEERLELYFVDAAFRIRYNQSFSSFSADNVSVQVEELSRLLALHRPHGVVVAHNHPPPVSRPSRADDEFTAQMQLICSVNGARLYDHIVLGTDGFYSYFLAGRMEQIRKDYSMTALVKERRIP